MDSRAIIILQVLVAFQCGLFSSFLLATSRRKQSGNAALAVMLMMLGTQMLTLAAQWSGLIEDGVQIPHLFGFLYGPCLLTYVRGLVYAKPRLNRWAALHFIPFLVSLILWRFGFMVWQLLMVGVIVSWGAYLVPCFIILNHYRRVIENTRSDLQGLSLRWLRIAIGLWAAIYGFYVARFVLLVTTTNLDMRFVQISIGLYTALLVFVGAFVLAALAYPDLFQSITPEEEYVAAAISPDSHIQPSAEDTQTAEHLGTFMTQVKPYLQPKLTVTELADQLDMQPRRLSKVINQCYRQNFSDFVNSYRIDAAKLRLLDPAKGNENLLEVMYATGFHSKSVFNATFKLKTGLSPSKYRKRHKK